MAYRTTSWKNTDIGKIPSDWECLKIKEFTDIRTGGTPSTQNASFWNGRIRWMNSGELNKKFVYDVANRITEAGLNGSSTSLIPPECVLIGLAGQGKTRGTVAMNFVELCTNQSIAAIIPGDNFKPKYLYYNLDDRYSELRALSTGDGGRGGLNKNILLNLGIPVPSISEQQKIAEVLTDIDGLITELERVRDKKIAIKTGVMQELLTGKRRLPGFNKPWKEVELGEIGIFDTCSGKSRYQDTFGKYLIVDMGAVSSDGKLIACKYSNYAHDFLKTGELVMPKDDIGGGLIIGRTAVIPENNRYIMGDHVFKITVLDTENPYFISAMINSDIVNKNIHKLVTGSAQLGLAKSNIKRVTIKVPTDKSEQTAIADILADMDDEISVISNKINKYKQIKSGVAGELLSGRIRLVKPQE